MISRADIIRQRDSGGIKDAYIEQKKSKPEAEKKPELPVELKNFLNDDGTIRDEIYGYEMNDDFKKFFNLAKQGENIFLSGSGGVGKSVAVEIVPDFLKALNKGKKFSVAKVAPTGIAALRIDGATIHSTFSLPIKPLGWDVHVNKDVQTIIKNLDVLIIDEISMVRSDVFNALCFLLETYGKNPSAPFGGIQIILVGDIFQLPPVVQRTPKDDEYKFLLDIHGTIYFFETVSFRNGKFKPVEFKKVYRQENQEFQDRLNKLRIGDVDKETLDYFNARVIDELEFCETVGEDYVYLCSTNRAKDEINKEMMAGIPEQKKVFHPYISGDIKPSDHPFEDPLELKKSAQVMAVWNDPAKRFVNGSIGKVVDFTSFTKETGEIVDAVVVDFSGKGESTIIPLEISKKEWKYDKETKKIEGKEIGKIVHIPVVPSWARTIHKSQSASFDKVYIDFGKNVFSNGMVYTALSRCRSYEHLGLKRPIKVSECYTEEAVREFYFEFFCGLDREE